MTALSIETIQSRVAALPVMPSVTMDLMLAFADEELGTETLARKLSRDQALVARVLRVANSPFYGLMRQVCTVQEAIVVLGLSSVRMLVTAAAVIGQFPTRAHHDPGLRAFWRQLQMAGASYTPQHLDAAEFRAIAESASETGP